jgi:hypothetical protein
MAMQNRRTGKRVEGAKLGRVLNFLEIIGAHGYFAGATPWIVCRPFACKPKTPSNCPLGFPSNAQTYYNQSAQSKMVLFLDFLYHPPILDGIHPAKKTA